MILNLCWNSKRYMLIWLINEGMLGKNKVRLIVKEKGFEWSGKYTPARSRQYL